MRETSETRPDAPVTDIQGEPVNGTSPTAAAADNGKSGDDPAPRELVLPDAEQSARSRGRFGWLPWSAKGTSHNGQTHHLPLVGAGDGTVIGEQFRVLRSRIETVGPGALMITSALAQEGKTLCAMNLTLALSLRIDAGVILVDADLRRPSAGASFGIRSGRGLADCLLGEAHWQDCLVDTPYENLRLLPAGRRTSVAPELLGSERMQAVVAEMKREFPRDYLLFDTPPILLTADPMVIARHMDHVLLVVRAGMTPRASVLKAIKILGAERFLGVVLNDATDSVSDYYYYGGQHQYFYGKS
jgi:capsular exopolysaccharide synthesis family protein